MTFMSFTESMEAGFKHKKEIAMEKNVNVELLSGAAGHNKSGEKTLTKAPRKAIIAEKKGGKILNATQSTLKHTASTPTKLSAKGSVSNKTTSPMPEKTKKARPGAPDNFADLEAGFDGDGKVGSKTHEEEEEEGREEEEAEKMSKFICICGFPYQVSFFLETLT